MAEARDTNAVRIHSIPIVKEVLMMVTHGASVLLVGFLLVPGLANAQGKLEVAYPEDYRTWVRVKSMVILEGHQHFEAFGGFHHVYANAKALTALKHGGPFAKGSILVFDLREAITKDHAISEGSRQVLGVMEKDPDRFPLTAGWGFEDFKVSGGTYLRAVTEMRTSACPVTTLEKPRTTSIRAIRIRVRRQSRTGASGIHRPLLESSAMSIRG
jgi:hypothetical protein